MRFRGGGVGHSSTRAATDVFKQDRDNMDIESRRAREKQCAPPNVEEEEGNNDIYMDTDLEGSVSEAGEVDEDLEDELPVSESELVDYGYERDGEDSEDSEDSDEDDRDVGEEDDTTIDELGALGYADY
jgi:hypothetical protein